MDLALRLLREPSKGTSTIGALFVNKVWQMWTLEDLVREIPGRPVAEWKVKSQTAIPLGTYPLSWSFSQRFQRYTPEILDVPGFVGIRIHRGNTSADTEGCLLVGYDRADDRIGKSTQACDWLDDEVMAAYDSGGQLTISIEAV